MKILVIILFLLLNYNESYVNYGCFDVLCNNGQYGYYYNSSITYVYIPYDIVNSLITIGSSSSNNYIYNNITICLSISSHYNENENDTSYCISKDRIDHDYDNDTISIPNESIGLHSSYWNISITSHNIIENMYRTDTYSYENVIYIIEVQNPYFIGNNIHKN